jgi:hypothetical protein
MGKSTSSQPGQPQGLGSMLNQSSMMKPGSQNVLQPYQVPYSGNSGMNLPPPQNMTKPYQAPGNESATPGFGPPVLFNPQAQPSQATPMPLQHPMMQNPQSPIPMPLMQSPAMPPQPVPGAQMVGSFQASGGTKPYQVPQQPIQPANPSTTMPMQAAPANGQAMAQALRASRFGY